jgi:hypothetical protein
MIEILPDKDKVLRQAIRRGNILRFHIRPVPQGNTPPLRTLRQLDASREIVLAVKGCARSWLSVTGQEWRIEYATDERYADIVIGFGRLTETIKYDRAMITGWSSTFGTAYIQVDTAVMRWSAWESKLGPIKSIIGTWRIPFQGLLLHEVGHAFGLGHTTERRKSVMYAAEHELAPQPDLHTRSGIIYPTEGDKQEFLEYYNQVEASARSAVRV